MAIWDSWIKNKLQEQISDLMKSDEKRDADSLPDIKPPEGTELIGGKSFISDPFYEQMAQNGIAAQSLSRISRKTLKELSLRDWVVNTAIQCRSDTLLRFSRKSHDKFNMGFRFVKKNDEENISEEDETFIAQLEDFVYNCGKSEGTPAQDKMLFGDFLKLTTRDALTFGHIAVEKVLTRGGGLHRFRPLPAESVYRINKRLTPDMIAQTTAAVQAGIQPGPNDPRQGIKTHEQPSEFWEFVQMSEHKQPLAIFSHKDMIFHLANLQNFSDSMGYCMSVVEMAMLLIGQHLHVENYNSNFFTNGYASRGILHLKGTVTNSALASFRRQFYNSINGTANAWRTPIIGGLDEVNWIPMSGSAKEMEYINYNNHLMRGICSMFQIDPMEIGLDFLVTGNGKAAQQTSAEYKIEYSRERGLYPILMMFEDLVNNSIVPAIDQKLADKYRFEFVGYTDETPQTQVAQLQAEMSVHATMNDLLRAAQKNPIEHKIADIPLNAAFITLMEKNMTRGEIREFFLKDKGASERKELQYIPGDSFFEAWQQLLLTIDDRNEQKRQQAIAQEAQNKQMELEANKPDPKQQKQARDQEAHDAEMSSNKDKEAHDAVAHGSLKDSAKQFGYATRPISAGGRSFSNPINQEAADHDDDE